MLDAFGSLFVLFEFSVVSSGRGVVAVVESLRKEVGVDGLSSVIWVIYIANLSKSVVSEEVASQSFRHMIFTVAWMPLAEVSNS